MNNKFLLTALAVFFSSSSFAADSGAAVNPVEGDDTISVSVCDGLYPLGTGKKRRNYRGKDRGECL